MQSVQGSVRSHGGLSTMSRTTMSKSTSSSSSYKTRNADSIARFLSRKANAKIVGHTMGAGPRPCLDYSGEYKASLSPGPGEYDWAICHHGVAGRSTTFDAQSRRCHGTSEGAHMVAKLTEQRRMLNNRLRRVSDDIMTINTTRPDLGGMYLNQLQPERVQLIRWHDSCTAALEEAKEYTKEELGRTGRFGVRRNREIDHTRPHTSPFSHSSDRFFQPIDRASTPGPGKYSPPRWPASGGLSQ